MRTEGYVFTFVAIFLGVADVIYWYSAKDPTGATALAVACLFAILIASYSLLTARRVGLRLEDRPDAEIEEGAGELGFFSPYSWWPLAAALGVATTAIGWVFGWWLFIIGVAALGGGVSGFVLEYYLSPYHDV